MNIVTHILFGHTGSVQRAWIMRMLLIGLLLLPGRIAAQIDSVDIMEESLPLPGGAVGFSSGGTNALAMSGNFLFLLRTTTNGNKAIDVLDFSQNPIQLVSRIAPEGLIITSYAVEKNRLYLHDKDGGVATYEISNPANPIQIGFLDSLAIGNTSPLHTGNTYYRAHWLDTSLTHVLRVDMENPSEPKITSTTLLGRFIPRYADSSFLTGIDFKGNGYTFDVSKPGAPKLLGSYPGNNAFVARFSDIGYSGTGMILDLADPAKPKPIRRFDSTSIISFLTMIDGKLFTMSREEPLFDNQPAYSMNAWSLANPVRPQSVLRKDSLRPFTLLGASGNDLFLLEQQYIDSTGFDKVFIPSRIRNNGSETIQSLVTNDPLMPHSIAIAGEKLIVGSPEGLFRYNLESLGSIPTREGNNRLKDVRELVTLEDTLAFVANQQKELMAVAMRDNADARILSSVSGISGNILQNLGRFIFASDDNGSIISIDGTDPFAIGPVDTLDLGPGNLIDMAVSQSRSIGAVAFGGPTTFGVHLLDLRDPLSLKKIGSIPGSQTRRAMSVSILANTLIVAANSIDSSDQRWFMQSYNISNPASPSLISELTGAGRAFETELIDSLAIGSMPGGSIHTFMVAHDGKLTAGPLLHMEPTADLAVRRTGPGEYQVIAIAGGRVTSSGRSSIGTGGLRALRITRRILASAEENGNGGHELELYPGYPNPGGGGATISYRLPVSAHARLALYNMQGELISVILDERQTAGMHIHHVETDEFAAGMYVVELRAGEGVRSGVMMVVR